MRYLVVPGISPVSYEQISTSVAHNFRTVTRAVGRKHLEIDNDYHVPGTPEYLLCVVVYSPGFQE